MNDDLAPPRAATLDDLAQQINHHHGEAFAHLHESLNHARHAGELLLQAKAQCAHGQWLPWLTTNLTCSVRTAQGYMRVAQRWPVLQAKNATTVAHLGLKEALRLLAEPHEDDADDEDTEDVELEPELEPAPEPELELEPEPKSEWEPEPELEPELEPEPDRRRREVRETCEACGNEIDQFDRISGMYRLAVPYGGGEGGGPRGFDRYALCSIRCLLVVLGGERGSFLNDEDYPTLRRALSNVQSELDRAIERLDQNEEYMAQQRAKAEEAAAKKAARAAARAAKKAEVAP